MFSKGSCRSISFAMETPSLVIVGAPHVFARTTLRPFGPRVTFTVSARMFIPRSRPRRASSSNAMILAMWQSNARPHEDRSGERHSLRGYTVYCTVNDVHGQSALEAAMAD